MGRKKREDLKRVRNAPFRKILTAKELREGLKDSTDMNWLLSRRRLHCLRKSRRTPTARGEELGGDLEKIW